MANKLFLVFATLTLFFLLTNASIHRTIVEFDEESDDSTNPMAPMQKCQKEFQQEQHLRACQRFIRTYIRRGLGGGGPALDDDDTEEPQGPPHLHECCRELRQEDPVCVCPTLREAARAIKFQGQHGPFKTWKIYQAAKHLPEACEISQVGICSFPTVPPFPHYY